MTLILRVRTAISGSLPIHTWPEILAGKWDLHQNLGSPALGSETNRSAQHCCSLSHALNAQAVGGDSHCLSVKAASVIDYRYLQCRGRTRRFNADFLGLRMSGYVGQGFLNNAIQPDLDC